MIYVFILLNSSKYVVVANTKFQYSEMSKIEITFYKHLSTTQTKKYCFFFSFKTHCISDIIQEKAIRLAISSDGIGRYPKSDFQVPVALWT